MRFSVEAPYVQVMNRLYFIEAIYLFFKQIRKITQVSNVQHLTLELEYKDEDCELKDC